VSGFEYGGMVVISTKGDSTNHRIAEAPATSLVGNATVPAILDKLHIESKYVLVIADPGNSATIKVGPNGVAAYPLGAGLSFPLQFVDPAEIAFSDGGVAGLLLYVMWGAASDRWFAARQAAKAAGPG
jgi:hypothetical protein